MTEWRNCLPPYDRYMCSDDGQFMNENTGNLKQVFWNHTGRPQVGVWDCATKNTKVLYMHLLMWEAFMGPVPANHFIVPIDGDWHNLVLENLEAVTVSEYRKRQFRAREMEYDRIFRETQSEFDDWIFGSCTESEEERRHRLA